MVLSYFYILYIELLAAIQDGNSALERFLGRQFGITKLLMIGSTAMNQSQLPSLPLFTKVFKSHFRNSLDLGTLQGQLLRIPIHTIQFKL